MIFEPMSELFCFFFFFFFFFVLSLPTVVVFFFFKTKSLSIHRRRRVSHFVDFEAGKMCETVRERAGLSRRAVDRGGDGAAVERGVRVCQRW